MARDRAARPEAKPLRLFVAVDVPSDVRDELDAALAPLRERIPGARWPPARNWHVTVKFLGRTWPRLVGEVTEAVGDVASEARPFRTRVGGLGAFPSPRRARVVWAGLDDAGGELSALAAGLDAALAREYPPEARPYAPHLTVARLKTPAPLGELPPLAGTPFGVDRMVLYRSRLQRPAPVYEPLGEFRLGEGRRRGA